MAQSNTVATDSVSGRNNLSYLNQQEQSTVLVVRARRNPTVNDRRYKIGTDWINTLTNEAWKLTSVVSNQANWAPSSLGISSFPVTPYVVGPVGQAGYQTIQAALDAANAAGGGIVAVQPDLSPYNENLTLYDKTQVVGVIGLGDGGQIIINGVHNPPTTGNFIFRNLQLESATHIYSSTEAGTASLIIIDAQLEITNGYVYNCPNWAPGGNFEMFDINAVNSTNDGGVNNTGGATVRMFNCGVGFGTNPMIVSGPCTFFGVGIGAPIDARTGANIDIDDSVVTQPITLSNNSILDVRNSTIIAGSNAAITHNSSGVVSLSETVINSTNDPAIDGSGAGVLTIGSITFSNNSNIAGTLSTANANLTVGNFNSRGDFSLPISGSKLSINGTAVTDSIGIAILVAGTVTVANTDIGASDRIFVVRSTTGGTEGHLSYTINAGVSFTINSSSGTDTSTVAYLIIRQL